MQQDLQQLLKSYLKETKQEIIQLRRVIHQKPELSFEEYETADLIYSK